MQVKTQLRIGDAIIGSSAKCGAKQQGVVGPQRLNRTAHRPLRKSQPIGVEARFHLVGAVPAQGRKIQVADSLQAVAALEQSLEVIA